MRSRIKKISKIKARILITTTDNLNGYTQTIKNAFPDFQTQICVVHQIRSIREFL